MGSQIMDTEFELIVNTKSRPTSALYWKDFQNMIQLAEYGRVNQFVISNEDTVSDHFSAQNFKKLSKNQGELVTFEINPDYSCDILPLFEETGFHHIYEIYIKLTRSNYTDEEQEAIEKIFSEILNFKNQKRVDKIGIMINSMSRSLITTVEPLDFIIFEDTDLFSDEAINFGKYFKSLSHPINQEIISNAELASRIENRDTSKFFNFSVDDIHKRMGEVPKIKDEKNLYYKSKQIDKIIDLFNLFNNDASLKFNLTKYYKVDVLKRVIEAKYSFESLKDKAFGLGYKGIMIYAEDCYAVNLVTKEGTLSSENLEELVHEFVIQYSGLIEHIMGENIDV